MILAIRFDQAKAPCSLERDFPHGLGAEDFAIVEPLRHDGAALISWWLLHFQFDTANPASDKIVNGGADESHHAVDHGH